MKTLGGLLIAVGVALIVLAFQFQVHDYAAEAIASFGRNGGGNFVDAERLHTQMIIVQLGIGSVLAGAILFAGGAVVEALRAGHKSIVESQNSSPDVRWVEEAQNDTRTGS